MRFHIHGGVKKGERVAFDLLGSDGAVLLQSAHFEGRDACTESIRAALAHLFDAEHFDVIVDGNAFVLVFQGDGGRELARSRPLRTEDEAHLLRDEIVNAAALQQTYEVDFDDVEGKSVLPFHWDAHVDFGSFYDFAFASRSGKPGFECFFREDKNLYYFHFNGADGNAILFSRGFDSGARRDKRLRSVAESAGLLQRFEKQEAGAFHFILKARNGQEIARSRAFASHEERDRALQWVHAQSAIFAEEHLRRHAGRIAGRDKYEFGIRSEWGKPGFDAFRHDGDKRYYFVYYDDDGRAALFSQGYQSKEGRDNGIRALIKNAAEMNRYQFEEESGRHYFVVRAANHQAIARSRFFDLETEARGAMLRISPRLADWAAMYGVDLKIKAGGGAARAEVRKASLTLSVERNKPATEPPPAIVEEPKSSAPEINFSAPKTNLPLPAVIDALPETNPPLPEIISAPVTGNQALSAPATVIPEPIPFIAEPIPVVQKPIIVERKPIVEKPKPITNFAKPIPAVPEPTPVVQKPIIDEQKPVVPEPTPVVQKPIIDEQKPIVEKFEKTKPIVEKPKPITNFAKPIPVAPEPTPVVQKPIIVAPEPAPVVQKPIPVVPEPAPVVQKPIPAVPEPAPVVQKPIPVVPEPTPIVQKPIIDEQKPITNEQIAPNPAPIPAPRVSSRNTWLLGVLAIVTLMLFLFWCKSQKPESSTASIGSAPNATEFTPIPSALPSTTKLDSPREHDISSTPLTTEHSSGQTITESPHDDAIAQVPHDQQIVFPPGTMEAALVAFLEDGSAGVSRTFEMDRLHYPPNSHEVNDAGQLQVVAIAKILAAYPKARIRIIGHRDGTENERYTGPNPHDDFPLSKIRAHCIYRRLRTQKVAETRMEFIGESADHPIAEDSTPAGRQKNRRIEIVVMKN